MSLLFTDGFDLYSAVADLEAAGWVINTPGNVLVQTTGGRFGDGAIKVQDNLGPPYLSRPVNIDANRIFVQFACKVENLSAATDEAWILFLNNSGQDQVCRLMLQVNGSIQVEDAAGAVIGTTAAGVIQGGIWHYMEFEVVSNGSTGSIIIMIDETQVLNETGLDTSITATDVDEVRFFSGSNSATEGTVYDDVIVLDDAGTSPHNDSMGDLRITTLLPNADVAGEADWDLSTGSNGYELIDEAVPGDHDGDGTYIYDETAGGRSLFEFENLPIDPHQVLGVTVATQARKDDAGTINMRTVMNSNSVIDNGGLYSPSTDYQTVRQIRERDPDGAGLFDKTAVDALKVGVEIEPPPS
jgi:hypothetical protein